MEILSPLCWWRNWSPAFLLSHNQWARIKPRMNVLTRRISHCHQTGCLHREYFILTLWLSSPWLKHHLTNHFISTGLKKKIMLSVFGPMGSAKHLLTWQETLQALLAMIGHSWKRPCPKLTDATGTCTKSVYVQVYNIRKPAKCGSWKT